MKTLNFEVVENYVLTNDEMMAVRGGTENDGDPTPIPTMPPIKV